MKNAIKIFLVDDSESFRRGLRLFLEDILNYKVVGEASNGREFLNAYKSSADIVLMDIEMPEMNGFDATKLHLWENPKTKFIAISSYRDALYLESLIMTGFKGCVFKQNVFEFLQDAIKKVLKGDLYYPKGIKMNNDIKDS